MRRRKCRVENSISYSTKNTRARGGYARKSIGKSQSVFKAGILLEDVSAIGKVCLLEMYRREMKGLDVNHLSYNVDLSEY